MAMPEGVSSIFFMVIPSSDCCWTGLTHAEVLMRAFPHEFVRCSASGGHDMGLLSKSIIFANEQISSGSGFNASGSEKRTVAGGG